MYFLRKLDSKTLFMYLCIIYICKECSLYSLIYYACILVYEYDILYDFIRIKLFNHLYFIEDGKQRQFRYHSAANNINDD